MRWDRIIIYSKRRDGGLKKYDTYTGGSSLFAMGHTSSAKTALVDFRGPILSERT